MVRVTIPALTPNTLPDDGWKVRYRLKGSSGAYTVPVGSPYTALPIVFDTTDAAGTLYEVQVARDCGTLESTWFTLITPCDCTTAGYVPAAGNTECRKTTTVSPTITSSDYCLIESKNTIYSVYGSRIYNPGFSNSTLLLAPGTVDAFIYGELTLSPQWANPSGILFAGPLNREGVWIDSDCDGNRDSLTAGTKVTIAFMYNNTGAAKTIFLGVAGDNQFKVVVNGVTVADTGASGSTVQFRTWHLIPVEIVQGINYFNAIGTGDGSVDDSIGMAGYDNTAAELADPTNATDSDLNVIFKSSNLRGTHFDVATCASGYSLDISGGVGSYACVKVETKSCNTAT